MSISRHQAVGAYRRWQPTDFDAPQGAQQAADAGKDATRPAAHQGTAHAAGAAAPSPAAAAQAAGTAPSAGAPTGDDAHRQALADHGLPLDFQLPTAEEIERMHEEIRQAGLQEGREQGLEQGYQEGLEAGRQAGYAEGKARAEEEAARLAALADGLERALEAVDAEVAEEIMALAIEMARRMVRHTLAEHPESVLETLRAALLQLPQGHAQIHLHPDDLALAREHMGETLTQAGHRLHADARLQRGECLIDGQGAQVDATLETRWRRVLESIGHDHARWAQQDAPEGEASAHTGAAAAAPENAAPDGEASAATAPAGDADAADEGDAELGAEVVTAPGAEANAEAGAEADGATDSAAQGRT